MKKPFEHGELLADVLADTATEGFRAATLNRGLTVMRRTRQRRRVLRFAVSLLVIALTMLWVAHKQRTTTSHIAGQSAVQTKAARTIEGTRIHILSDKDLLAYFKDRPVALAGPPGQQRLFLLDEVSH